MGKIDEKAMQEDLFIKSIPESIDELVDNTLKNVLENKLKAYSITLKTFRSVIFKDTTFNFEINIEIKRNECL